ncbi:MAG: DNA-binding transcriptional regulator [Verrucomicrobia bacterium]|nr:DNA-binding transcriptional regulator [Verrucomicrobiota bacterium]
MDLRKKERGRCCPRSQTLSSRAGEKLLAREAFLRKSEFMPQGKRKRVILLLETHFNYGREILDGIAHYQHVHGSWECWFRPWQRSSLPPNLNNWDGVIGRFRFAEDVALFPAGMPLVNVSLGGQQAPDLPTISPDEHAIGAAVADAFRERGFRKFAVVGLAGRCFANERIAGFVAAVEAMGLTPPEEFRYSQVIRHVETQFVEWLQSQPRPLAIFACNDVTGREILEVLIKLQIKVPDEVAVIGVDNDQQVCSLSFPQLSSVRTNAQLIGFKAAELLHAMHLNPDFIPPLRTKVPHLGIQHRLSSDIFAVDDPAVAKALGYVRDHLHESLHVVELAKYAGVSRKTLELKFEQFLGSTPAGEIRARRVRKALELLAGTQLSMSEIAERIGIRDQSALSTLVRQKTGMTPMAYRRQHCN